MKLKVKDTLTQALNALRPKTWLFSRTDNATYGAGAYVGFPTTDSDNYDNTTVTHEAGLITIYKKGTYLVNVHVGTQAQTSNRSFLKLVNYNNGNTLAQAIFYGTWSTCTMSKVIKVTNTPLRLGVQPMEKVNVNSGGVGPSYFQVTQVGGVARNILKALQSLPYRKVVIA